MISEQDKQKILNGAYGITRNGIKCKYIGLTNEAGYIYFFVALETTGEIKHSFNLTEKFKFFKDEEHILDVIGLWEDKPEPFDLERALAGEPVKLRNGSKAYIKYIMPNEYTGLYPLTGYMLCGTALYTYNWAMTGESLVNSKNQPNDIIGMWKDPEPEANTVTFTLPRALKEPQDEMWFVASEGYMKSGYGRNIPEDAFKRIPYFGAEAHAKAWFDAMQNSRK